MSLRRVLKDESGMTLVELLVATATGTVVMAMVTAVLITTMHVSNRVASHVEANQLARLTMGKVIDQLHSSCVAYDYAPIKENSNGSTLIFTHQTGSAVQPVPVKSEIVFSGGKLTQADYPSTGGSAPNWTFATSPATTTTLTTNVSQIGSTPIFRYYGYNTSGAISSTPLAEPLNKENAERAVQVSVAFGAGPRTLRTANDSGAVTPIQSSALLRLTPASFEAGPENSPCQ
ncbi:MAG TPA: prepilin-type N-terminal cleavage/methylation domain-containing protein [Solirubrobacterales bacterium]